MPPGRRGYDVAGPPMRPARTIALTLCIATATGLHVAAQAPGAAEGRRTGHDIEVRVVGCVMGAVLTEVDVDAAGAKSAAGSDEAATDAVSHRRRWRLRVTPAQQKILRAGAGRRVEVVGIADRREMARAELAAERRSARPASAGPAGAPMPAAARGASQPPPSLVVTRITTQPTACQ